MFVLALLNPPISGRGDTRRPTIERTNLFIVLIGDSFASRKIRFGLNLLGGTGGDTNQIEDSHHHHQYHLIINPTAVRWSWRCEKKTNKTILHLIQVMI